MYTVDELTVIINRVAKGYHIRKVILVGSYAHNVATAKSDVDLVVDGDNLDIAYWDILFELEDILRVPVDLMTMHGVEGSLLKESLLKGGLVLYEA